MNGLIRLEILRVLRNRKFQFFSVLYPSLLFLLIAGTADSTGPLDGTDGLTLPAYLMVSMASFGALTAVLMGNSERIAKERENGWGAPRTSGSGPSRPCGRPSGWCT